MLTYDQIWQTFLDNYKASNIDIPQDDERIYQCIHNAVLLFNNRMRKQVVCEDITEMVNGELTYDDLLIISHYIRLVFLNNDRTFFEKLYQPFAADVGVRNFNTQLNSLKTSIEQQKDFIETLILNSMEEFL
ncbi:hypothetical protein [Psychrobacillus phage Perkons]|nr:hypothetical protein [Psychrobacillus phage Perkons]